ncbi:hypothetical protein ABGV42_16975 [Paenibacillus pabuli]|uniref:hypothetical protein n=1 Tax=Paenibacillus pabuli TaxID=1472 RepID=UPI00324295A6
MKGSFSSLLRYRYAGSEEAAASVDIIFQISSGVSDHSDDIYRLMLEQQTNEMSEAVRKVKV